MDLKVEWLGRLRYREAWAVQRARHAARDAGEIADTLLLVEHEPVLTLGRHARDEHVIASPDELARRGIEVIRVERGGEVTYHGPGQLVAYPIVRLRELPVLLRPFVRALELTMGDVAARYGVEAAPRPGYPGVWIERAARPAAQAWSPRSARRARHQLPRHRAQHHHAARGLRAHRPLRHGRPGRHLGGP